MNDIRKKELIAKLADNGWRVVHRECDDLEWWAEELWTAESTWSPKGLTLLLTWLIDPMPGDAKAARVWAVGASTDALEPTKIATMPLNHWPRDLPEFLDELAKFRQQNTPSE